MRLGARLVWVLLVVGCNEVSAPNTVPLTLTVRTLDPETASEVPLEGAQLCQTDTANCDPSVANGEATIWLPINERISWTLTKGGYGSTIAGDVTDELFDSDDAYLMRTHEFFANVANRLETIYPNDGAGFVHIRIIPGFAGATFKLIDATGKPWYADEEGRWSLGLDATTSRGRGGFVEVPPGEVQVEIGGAAQNCQLDWAWPGDADSRIRIPVRGDHLTYAVLFCPTPP